jgi:hypothetical protein
MGIVSNLGEKVRARYGNVSVDGETGSSFKSTYLADMTNEERAAQQLGHGGVSINVGFGLGSW